MRNYYKEGFVWDEMIPVAEKEGTVLIKAILASDFEQVIHTDMTDSIAKCKVWEVVNTSANVTQIVKGDHVLVILPGIDMADPDSPRYGVVDARDIRLKVPCKSISPGLEKVEEWKQQQIKPLGGRNAS